jgi:hypothetical protein
MEYESAPAGYSTKELLNAGSNSSDMFFKEADRWTEHVINSLTPSFLNGLLEQKGY